MTHTPTRLAYIAGLRDLADFFDTNPDVPTPEGPVIAYYFPRGTDEKIRDQVDHVARLLSSQIDPDYLPYGHYTTQIRFGIAEYRAVGLLASTHTQHASDDDHQNCCTAPDTDTATHSA
ncbi:hypothetical protein [Sphaerisporangium corydalis]|uniref:Uncharacterized protein n=1 Tax=Sphaerisporangium corydalis TaxID=1441875 RepID=A0ABV9EU36_9ACTN|nr:hypothetical protein [Sphaerisporangium corydalis]